MRLLLNKILPKVSTFFGRQIKCYSTKTVYEIPGPVRSGTDIFDRSLKQDFEGFQWLPERFAELQKQYGDLVKEYGCSMAFNLHIFHPDDMLRVYMCDGTLPRKERYVAIHYYRDERIYQFKGDGILASNGPDWLEYRTLLKTVLSDHKMLVDVSPVIESATDKLIENIRCGLDENNEVDVEPLLSRWSLDVMNCICLGKEVAVSQGEDLSEKLFEPLRKLHSRIFETDDARDCDYYEFGEMHDIFTNILEEFVEKYYKLPKWNEKPYLLSKLMKESKCRLISFTMLSDMYIAGTETVACALVNALYNLAKHPAAQDTLRQELLQIASTKEDCEMKRKYIDAVIQENFRYSPLHVLNRRITTQDIIMRGYLIPKNSKVLLQHQVACQSEDYFYDARCFKPERWLTGRSYIACSPFSFGNRSCLGKDLALNEISIALSKIVPNYEISYHHEPIGFITRCVNIPDRPVKLRFKKLNN